jgi:RES domain-containing protein
MMLEAWRICKSRHAATAFTGEGAAIAGGRWNSPGIRLVYVSASQSLALLENLVHVNPAVPIKLVAFHIKFPSALVKVLDLADLPSNWAESPAPVASQKVGDAWVAAGDSAVLALPSVIVPGERNYLLNPAHPDFKKVEVRGPADFPVDPRLL